MFLQYIHCTHFNMISRHTPSYLSNLDVGGPIQIYTWDYVQRMKSHYQNLMSVGLHVAGIFCIIMKLCIS
jgi:hypothetical protein